MVELNWLGLAEHGGAQDEDMGHETFCDWMRDMGNGAQDIEHVTQTQDMGHRTQDMGHRAHNAGHRTEGDVQIEVVGSSGRFARWVRPAGSCCGVRPVGSSCRVVRWVRPAGSPSRFVRGLALNWIESD